MSYWAVQKINHVSFFFISTEDAKKHKVTFALEERYANIKTVPGTRFHHACVPTAEGEL
jgi:hypothetical protein